jgi:kynurenine formamidase
MMTGWVGEAPRKEQVMRRLKWLFMCLVSIGVAVLFDSVDVAIAGDASKYPLDEKLANEPAPWTVKGKWGERGNWGRWGEEDKRGMLNFITPEMIVNAAKLVTRGKVYALGEEMHNDVPRLITPVRFGPQILQERDGHDRVTKPGEFDPKQRQGAASYTIMHNHTGSHLDTFAHVYRENKLYNNLPAPRADGTVHGDAASVKYIVGRGVLLDVAKYKGQDPLPSNYWISQEDLQNTAKAQKIEIQKGDILLIRTGWRKMWDQPGPDGRHDQAHSAWHQPQPGVGGDALGFLNEMEIVAIGADNAAVEWNAPREAGYTPKAFGGFLGSPLHVDFLWNRGAYIIEILNLDELAADQAYEFLFVVGPLLQRGGIGVPINPIALR